jgi:hypothetical protein
MCQWNPTIYQNPGQMLAQMALFCCTLIKVADFARISQGDLSGVGEVGMWASWAFCKLVHISTSTPHLSIKQNGRGAAAPGMNNVTQ